MNLPPIDEDLVRVHQRIIHALEVHHLPDTPWIQQARDELRERLELEPNHRTVQARIRYLERALRRFERAVEQSERYVLRDAPMPSPDDEPEA